MHASNKKDGPAPPAGGIPEPLRTLFFDSNGQLVEKLARATARYDVETALHLAHAVKGAALFADFPALAEAASEAEAHLRGSHPWAARRAIARARALLRANGP